MEGKEYRETGGRLYSTYIRCLWLLWTGYIIPHASVTAQELGKFILLLLGNIAVGNLCATTLVNLLIFWVTAM